MSVNSDDTMSNNIRELSNGMNWNTHKSMTYCKCGKIAIDGCEYYVRVNGNEGDWKIIKRVRSKV